MLFVKSTVRPRNIFIAAACVNVAITLNRDVTITSADDGKHMRDSKHYSGDALDIRSKDFTDKAAKLEFISRVIERLGHSYQGILEDEGRDNEHFHFEYDPA